MTEPTTVAGRRLLENEGTLPLFIGALAEPGEHVLLDAILAIEQEARADLAARIIAAVEGVYEGANPGYSREPDRDEVLDAIREASDDRRA